MSAISEHDLRQLSLMIERLNMFERGQLSLGVIISDLEFLLGALNAIDSNTMQELREQWGLLEEVYSVAKTMHGGQLKPDDRVFVSDTVKTLRDRVAKLIPA